MTEPAGLLESSKGFKYADLYDQEQVLTVRREFTTEALKKQRFVELHKRLDKSSQLIADYDQSGKVNMAGTERIYAGRYRDEIGILRAIAMDEEISLELPSASVAEIAEPMQDTPRVSVSVSENPSLVLR